MSFHQRTEKDRVKVRICHGYETKNIYLTSGRTFRPAVTSHRSAVYALRKTATLPCANLHISQTKH